MCVSECECEFLCDALLQMMHRNDPACTIIAMLGRILCVFIRLISFLFNFIYTWNFRQCCWYVTIYYCTILCYAADASHFFFSVATFLLPLLLPLWSIILCVRSLFPALFGWNSIFLSVAGYSTSMCATFTCYFSAKILILYAYTKLQNTKYVVG